MVKAVNGTIPGPPIVVYVDQIVKVHIRNMLLSDSTTIHFHGLHQKETPYFDGMPYITQCPIAAGQTFTHEFKVGKFTLVVKNCLVKNAFPLSVKPTFSLHQTCHILKNCYAFSVNFNSSIISRRKTRFHRFFSVFYL